MCWPEDILQSGPSNECSFSCFPRLFEVTVPPPLLIKMWLMTFGKAAAWKSQCFRKSKTSFQVFSVGFISETHKYISKHLQNTLTPPSPRLHPPADTSPFIICMIPFHLPGRKRSLCLQLERFPLGMAGSRAPARALITGLPGEPVVQEWLWDCSPQTEQYPKALSETPQVPP